MEAPSSHPDSDPSEPEQKKLKLAHELYGHLFSALNDWSDEIPNQILSSGNYKVRINWWNVVSAFLKVTSDKLISEPGLKNEIQQFYDKYTSQTFWKAGTTRTQKEDIDSANLLIKKTLDYLSRIYPRIEPSE